MLLYIQAHKLLVVGWTVGRKSPGDPILKAPAVLIINHELCIQALDLSQWPFKNQKMIVREATTQKSVKCKKPKIGPRESQRLNVIGEQLAVALLTFELGQKWDVVLFTHFVCLASSSSSGRPPREIAFSLLLVGEQREVREAKTILSFSRHGCCP